MRPITSRFLVAVVTLEAVLILYVVSFFITMNSDNTHGGALPATGIAASSPLSPVATPAAQPKAAPAPDPTSTQDPRVAAALALKPLDALEDGDRVLFEGKVRFFRGWDERPQLAWITDTATSEHRLQAEVGRLTPVEAAARG